MQVIYQDGEVNIESLVEEIEEHAMAWRAVHCFWGDVSSDELHSLANNLKSVVPDEGSYLFKWGNEDVFVICRGARNEVLDAVKDKVGRAFSGATNKSVDESQIRVFDMSIEWKMFDSFFNERKKAVSEQVKDREDVDMGGNVRLIFDFKPAMKEKFGDARTKRRGTSVLCVNADPFSTRVVSSLLKGFSVLRANDAQLALDHYFENAPDMVFLDIDMPGYDGWEILEVIRQYDPQAFVIMMTENSTEEEVRKAIENGVQGYIKKPINQKKIDAYVNKFWKGAPAHKRITTV